MTDERYKELMTQIGMPNSRSLLQILQQVSCETALEQRQNTDARILTVVDSCFHAYAPSYRAEACTMAEGILRKMVF